MKKNKKCFNIYDDTEGKQIVCSDTDQDKNTSADKGQNGDTNADIGADNIENQNLTIISNETSETTDITDMISQKTKPSKKHLFFKILAVLSAVIMFGMIPFIGFFNEKGLGSLAFIIICFLPAIIVICVFIDRIIAIIKFSLRLKANLTNKSDDMKDTIDSVKKNWSALCRIT